MSDPQADLSAAKARLSGFARSAPALMQGFAALSRQATQPGSFSAAQKELVATAIAVAKGCEDCILYHLDAARRHGATCIFVSPVAMRIFDENGVCHPSFPEYREAMARFARQAGAVWLDLGAATAAAVTATGAEHAKSLYLWHGDKHDDAHLQQAGALRFARAFARLVLQSTDPRLDVLKAAFEEE